MYGYDYLRYFVSGTNVEELIDYRLLNLLSNIAFLIFNLVFFLAAIILIYLGILYLLHKDIEKVRKWILYVVIGIVVAFFARFLIEVLMLLLSTYLLAVLK